MSLNGQDFLRYSRQLLMADIAESGQDRLLKSRVLIVGLGGLGSPVSLYLAAAGVGEIHLCDPDTVDITNLQRQLLYATEDAGKTKTECALARLNALNPGLTYRCHSKKVDDTVLFDGSVEVVVDCTDNLATRHWLNRRCLELNIPLVSAAAMGWEGQLVTLDFSAATKPCLACAIPENSPEPIENCSNSGVLGPVLGILGSMQALTVLKLLLGHPVTDRLLQRFDGRRDQWQSFRLSKNPDCTVCSEHCDS